MEVSLVRSQRAEQRLHGAQEGRAMVSWADREGYAYPRTALPRLICEGSGEEGSPGPDLHR